MSITFQPGELKACGNITIIDDNEPETDNEEFIVQFNVAGGGAQSGTLTTATVRIIDNDMGKSRI